VTLDAGFYGRVRTGDILARATNDMNAVRMMLGPGVMYWFETSLTLVLSVSVMLWVDWRLTLVALIPAPFVSLAVMVFGTEDSRSLRSDPDHVLRHQQPRAGESFGRARGARLRAGALGTGRISRR
jgi:ABC-type multidrug transport system fused ATPase/permease subunit